MVTIEKRGQAERLGIDSALRTQLSEALRRLFPPAYVGDDEHEDEEHEDEDDNSGPSENSGPGNGEDREDEDRRRSLHGPNRHTTLPSHFGYPRWHYSQ